eukprot:CAMPEP_0172928690 /NCGR_PEP_ID=MMETSP1075-20121228/218104_1 /TAXON_ID=2916 /ORGANISM="Ceratium fusus, Strain PA161109" /LENGTH=408 /DNA_ID=CAMNT_0013789977 /DNA_START=92 /DNA_END=1316 /DNA_ORIENTATION=+
MKVPVPFTWAMASVSRISDEYFSTRVTRLTLNGAKLPEVKMVDERDGSAKDFADKAYSHSPDFSTFMQADEEAGRATRANLAQKVSAYASWRLERDRREEEEREGMKRRRIQYSRNKVGMESMTKEELEKRKRPGYKADEEADRAARANLAQKVSAYASWCQDRDRREEEERERHEEEEERERQGRRLIARKFPLCLLKAMAGAIRFLLDDVLNVLVQAAMLVKYWDESSPFMHGFTMASMAVAVLCSILFQLKDCWSARSMRRAAAEGVFSNKLSLETGQRAALDRDWTDGPSYVQLQVPLHGDQGDPEPGSMPTGNEEVATANPSVPHSKQVCMEEAQQRRSDDGTTGGLLVHLDEKRREEQSREQSANRELDLFEGGIIEFIQHKKLAHSVASHKLLIVASVLYW